MSLTTFLLLFIILSILVFFMKKRSNGPLNPIKKDLTGKLIIVTGSSDGIGLVTAKDLLNSNAKVIFACRNKEKTQGIINKLPDDIKQNAKFIELNLGSFKSIETFVKEIKENYPKIDILINNAGIHSRFIDKTEDGYISTYQVNYLGNVLLTLLLFEHFNEKESRIINVSSRSYKYSRLTYGDSKYLNNYNLMYNNYLQMRYKNIFYGNTKLLLNFFTQYLADLAEKKYSYLKVVCLHPGMVYTNFFKFRKILHKIFLGLIFNTIIYLFSKDLIHGAQTTLFLAYSESKDLVNGAYYNNLKIENYIPIAKDEKLRKEMVNETLNILKSKYKELEHFPLLE